MSRDYRVRVVDDQGFDEWRRVAHPDKTFGFHAAMKAHIEATGETILRWQGPDLNSFMWMCPGCGGTYGGTLGDAPVSGWDSPRWVNSGTREKPTLTPSLGCPVWRRGLCTGHWWLRDGELVSA